ncbi:MAG: multiheme c-type cytochrome [Anaerolineales bacterium]
MTEKTTNGLHFLRTFIAGAVMVIIIIGLGLVLMSINQATRPEAESGEPVDALALSTDECVTCHRKESPGIVEQYGHSTMAAAEVSCRDCHEVASDYPGAVEHEGTYVLASPSSAMCEACHQQEVAEFNQSRHSLPAYIAVVGTEGLSEEHMALYESIPEGMYTPDKSRNAIAALEGPDMTRFTCLGCHNIGKPAPDGSVGQCQKCHLRHRYSLEQARKPETCNYCHIGPDHPQFEIYQESPHGIAYATLGEEWDWEAEAGTLTTEEFSAATCAICHMSGFGTQPTTHDVGERLTWYLFAPVSTRRPNWEENMADMQGVCTECHNENFIGDFYTAADKATQRVNEWVLESQDIIAPLEEQALLTDAPFDEPIDYEFFNLWHHWGRTAKFGTWMQGPDYAQWHGAYEVLHSLAKLKEMVTDKLGASGEVQP